MAVSFVAASASGNSSNATTAAASSVPTGAASGDIAVAFLESWEGTAATPTITPPAGFTQKGSTWASGDGLAINSAWWKRLTGADSGTYSFTVSMTSGVTRWNTLQVMMFRGCAASGDPFDAVATPVAGTYGSIASMSIITTDADGALVFTVYNDTLGTHTPPTGFTEPTGVDVDAASCAYKLAGGVSGSQSISGASISSSSAAAAWAGALLSDTAGPPPTVDDLRLPVQIIQIP